MAKANKSKSSPHRDKAIADLSAKFPKASGAALVRMLMRDFPALYETRNAAECHVRWYRGKRGSESRKSAEHRGTAKPLGQLPLPESEAKPWLPFKIDASRVLCLSDIHIPFHDNAALEAALSYGDTFKPDAVLLNGDVLDFQSISKFSRDPRGPTLSDELKQCTAFLAHLRRRFPLAQIHWKLGNHEERWERFLRDKAPEILEIAEFAWHKLGGVKANDVNIIGEQRIVMCGKLPVLHGHELPRGISNPVNPARGTFLRAIDCALTAHQHRTSEHSERSMLGRVIACWSQGCLCDLNPEYSRINRWDHSFATVQTVPIGDYECRLHRIINGKVR